MKMPERFQYNRKDVVDKLRKIIQTFPYSRKTINRLHSSYGFKHIFETELGEYVKNDEFIEAMIREGYNCEWDGINAYFNVSERSIKPYRDNHYGVWS